MTRREVFQTTGLSALSYSRVMGANDRIQMGLIGAGERGQFVMTVFQKNADVQFTAICDVYARKVDEALGKAPGSRTFSDHRKLVEVKDLDAVLIGTPDHWHKDTAIDAMNAGKDVYVEKPLTRTIEEGPAIIRTARVTNRICQVGMQQRSGTIYLEARDRFLKSNALGKISNVRCTWHSGQAQPLRQEPAQQPSNLDWARYLGSVKWHDWYAPMYTNYRAFLCFGAGKMTDFGAHWLDVVHMFMGVDVPLSVSAEGGVFYDFNDGRTAPDTISALYEYPGKFSVTFESHAIPVGPEYGIEFYGEKGRLFINRNRYEFRPAEKGAPLVKLEIPGDITSEHVRNFLDCCKSRKLPNADVLIGHRGCQAALLGNEAYVQKRRIRFDPVREEILPL